MLHEVMFTLYDYETVIVKELLREENAKGSPNARITYECKLIIHKIRKVYLELPIQMIARVDSAGHILSRKYIIEGQKWRTIDAYLRTIDPYNEPWWKK